MPYRIDAVYTGDTRPLPPAKARQIAGWLVATGQDPRGAELFTTELRVEEGSAGHWLAVPDAVLTQLSRQLLPGAQVTLFVDWIGNTRTEPVFLLGRFER